MQKERPEKCLMKSWQKAVNLEAELAEQQRLR